jgi:HemY protein
MIRLVLFLLGVLAAAAGLHWLADRPGALVLDWQGYVVETTVFRAVILLTMLVAASILGWSLMRQLWQSPAAIGQIFTRRRERRGLDAISTGMIAIGSGDRLLATRAAVQARKSLPNEPLTHLLRAQAAQLQGDSATSRRIFEAMLASPDTEQVGLRGLFLEAQRVKEDVAAAQFAERALKLNPKIEWPAAALFDLQSKSRDWSGALDTLASARKNGHIEKKLADRRRAVLLTAQAQELEDDHADKACTLALEAHGLAPDLVPAAAIAGRVLASTGQTPRAAKVLQRTWKAAPHPDLAVAYAYARPGDSPSDRLERVRQLSKLTPGNPEGLLAIANTAIESRDWTTARTALEPLLDKDLSQRVCMLMARIEGEGAGNAGKVREWLARAVHAQRDPAWTADSVVSDRWAPSSPVTGALDAFEWRVPVSAVDKPEASLVTSRMEELMQLGVGHDKSLPEPARGSHERDRTDDATPAIEVGTSPAPRREPRAPVTDIEVATPANITKPVVTTPEVTPLRPTGSVTVKDGVTKTSRPAAVAASSSNGAALTKVLDPNAYITPHAPDDPGPRDQADPQSTVERFRLIGAKQ